MSEYSAETASFSGLPTGKTMLAGVMGWPVTHSRSPRLHGYWLRHYGIDGAYLPLAVRPEDFEAALQALPKLGFKGANVTVPHKEAAFRAMDDVDDFARRVGAVNTVIVQPDGRLTGRNTDGYGFIQNLKQSVPHWQAANGPAVVLGAGGAARGIIAALLDEGAARIIVTNRTQSRAEQLVEALDDHRLEVIPWPKAAGLLEAAALLVNSTTLGMFGGMSGGEPLALDLDGLAKEAVVYDIVYAPLKTSLLAAAEARGNKIVNGLGMLLHQARPGFEAWFGVKPDVTPELEKFVLAE
jgi:shikimate dehydrogenase